MKERPVLFNSEMVRAILDGRKTQTRRVVKPQPADWVTAVGRDCFCTSPIEFSARGVHPKLGPASNFHQCPFGAPGDRLWVRETWAAFDDDWRFPGRPHDLSGGPWKNIAYHADDSINNRNWSLCGSGWRPSIHMPRWASRITLEITDVRVDRLQKISEEDAKAEGAQLLSESGGSGWGSYDSTAPSAYTRRWGFKSAWNDCYSERASWGLNPWVWVVEFKRASP